MAVTKNTADLLTQVGTTHPDNSTQQISPQDAREAHENIIASYYNVLSDASKVGLKLFDSNISYENSQGVISGGSIYIANTAVSPGAFNPAQWDLYAALTVADKAKLDFITVTGAADLDQIQADLAALDQAIRIKGTWDPSSGSFPGGGTAQAGDYYLCTGTSGTVDGVDFTADEDAILAILDNASTTTYAANWFKKDGSDKVLSVNSQTGNVVLTKTDVGLSNVPNVDATQRANHTGTQLAATISDFQTAVSLNADVVANTAKVSNVTTDLSIGTKTGTTLDVNSSDGTNATIPSATITEAGLMSAADKVILDGITDTDDQTAAEVPYTNTTSGLTATDVQAAIDEVEGRVDANDAKVSNVTTDLSEGTVTTTTVAVNSSDGLNALLESASASRAGVMPSAKFSEVEANTLKTSNANHTGDASGSTALTLQPAAITGKTAGTVASADEVLISDADDSGNLKRVTAQSIADLAAGGDGNGIYDGSGFLSGATTVDAATFDLTIKGTGKDGFFYDNSKDNLQVGASLPVVTVSDFKISAISTAANNNGGAFVQNNQANGWSFLQIGRNDANLGSLGNSAWLRIGGSSLGINDTWGGRLEFGSSGLSGFTHNIYGTPVGWAFNWLTDGNLQMKLNADGLGIGVTPTAKLQVRGADLLSTSSALLVENSGGTDLLDVRNNGFIGVGVAPTAKLHVKGDDGLLLTKSIVLEDNIGNPAFLATNYGLIATKVSAPILHKSAYIHTFKNGYTLNNRGLAAFLDGNDNFALDIMTNGVGVGRDAVDNIGLTVKGKGTLESSWIFGGYDNANATQFATTVFGKLGLGTWGTGQLSAVNAPTAAFLNVPASTTDEPHIRLESGVDVTTPNEGAIWKTANDLNFRIGGDTVKLYQETTGVASALETAGTGSAILTDNTFDGYTVAQVVKALRNLGILA